MSQNCKFNWWVIFINLELNPKSIWRKLHSFKICNFKIASFRRKKTSLHAYLILYMFIIILSKSDNMYIYLSNKIQISFPRGINSSIVKHDIKHVLLVYFHIIDAYIVLLLSFLKKQGKIKHWSFQFHNTFICFIFGLFIPHNLIHTYK